MAQKAKKSNKIGRNKIKGERYRLTHGIPANAYRDRPDGKHPPAHRIEVSPGVHWTR